MKDPAKLDRWKADLKRTLQQMRQDLRVLRRIFPWRVGAALVLGIALLALAFRQAYLGAFGPEAGFSYVRAVYAVLNMATFQVSFADMPPGGRLDVFFVLVPMISIPLLVIFGANLLHVLRVFLVRQERGQMWQSALASTTEHPIVVCGLGHVGYRVASQLLDLQHPFIGIDTVPSPLVQSLVDQGAPVILGDVRDQDVLRRAGVERATAVIVCTYDDLANIEATFHIRELNPDARIVLRLFEDEMTDEIRRQFEIEHILSRSAIAAQTFAYAALGLDALEAFGVGTETYALAEIPISDSSPLMERSISQISGTEGITAVCLYRGGRPILEPPPDSILLRGDALFLFTRLDRLAHLAPLQDDEGATDIGPRPILVCGVGHTGYRVITTLRDLEMPVIALDLAPSTLSERLESMGIQVVYGDFRRASLLEQAGLRSAGAIVLCAEDDRTNLEACLRVREIAPETRTVMRIFEEPLGRRLQKAFGIDAVYSTSAIAAPEFVAAALNIHLTQPVTLGDEAYVVARMTVETLSGPLLEPIGDLTRQSDLTVLLHKRRDQINVPPDGQLHLAPGDEIVLLATREKLRDISLCNRGGRNGT